MKPLKRLSILTMYVLFITFFVASINTANAKESLVVVIDTSGSMKQVEPKVKRALQEFVDDLKPETHLSLVQFDVFSEILTQTKLESDRARQQVKTMVESLAFNGHSTNYDEAIKGAEVALYRNRQLRDGTILVLSDGLSDPSQGKAVIDLISLSQQVFPQREGFNIYLIGVSQNRPVTKKQIGNVTQLQIPRQGLGEVFAYVQNQSGTTVSNPVPPKIPNTRIQSLLTAGSSVFQSKMIWVYGLLALLLIASIGVYWIIRRRMLS